MNEHFDKSMANKDHTSEARLHPNFITQGYADSSYSTKFANDTASRTRDLVSRGTLPEFPISGMLPPHRPEDTQKYRDAADALNAGRAIKSLIPAGKDGLDRKDIDTLLADKSITKEQRQALDWMKTNYKELYTEGLVTKDRITPQSLDKYSRGQDLFDGLGRGKEMERIERMEKAHEKFVEKRIDSMKNETVQKGDGYLRIAQRSLDRRGHDYSYVDLDREAARIARLNPDKPNGKLQPGDKVRVLDQEGVRVEVDRHLDKRNRYPTEEERYEPEFKSRRR